MTDALPTHATPVPLDKAYRLLNHGLTVLVSAEHGGVRNVMAAAWACPLDLSPPKVTVVLDQATRTRELVDPSSGFALYLPTRAMAALSVGMGTGSAHTLPDKLIRHALTTACSAMGAGILKLRPRRCAPCTMWQVGTSMPLAKRWWADQPAVLSCL